MNAGHEWFLWSCKMFVMTFRHTNEFNFTVPSCSIKRGAFNVNPRSCCCFLQWSLLNYAASAASVSTFGCSVGTRPYMARTKMHTCKQTGVWSGTLTHWMSFMVAPDGSVPGLFFTFSVSSCKTDLEAAGSIKRCVNREPNRALKQPKNYSKIQTMQWTK